MSRPVPLQNAFNAGMRRDEARNHLSPESVWTMTDFLARYGAQARGRGGWQNHSSAISAVTATGTQVYGGVFANFSLTSGSLLQRNVIVDEDGLAYYVGAGTASLIGSARTALQNPVFIGGAAVSAASAVYTGLVIFPDGTGQNVPRKYDGTSISDLGGVPPRARYATVFKNYLLLGNGSAYATSSASAATAQSYALTAGPLTYYPNRLWFSNIGDPDSGFSDRTEWDLQDAWIDFSMPIAGLGASKNAILVFHEGSITRIRGNSPPPAEDMEADDPFLRIGLLDPFSITEYKDNLYWCAPEGVFRTDGVVLDDITKKGGMLRYWLDLTAGQSVSSYSFATGILRDFLIIAVTNGGTFVDAFMVDLQSYVWTRLSNLPATSMWNGTIGEVPELFFGRRNGSQVAKFSPVFSPGTSGFKTDGNGTAVAPVMETGFYEISEPGLKRVKRLFVGYELHDHASDSPTITISMLTNVEGTSYTTVGSLSATSGYKRVALDVNTRAPGYGFKFAQVNAGDFHLHDIAAEAYAREKSARE